MVAKKFMDKREGEVSRFPSKIFCLAVSKNAVGEPFGLSGYPKSLDERVRGVSRLPIENFFSDNVEKES